MLKIALVLFIKVVYLASTYFPFERCHDYDADCTYYSFYNPACAAPSQNLHSMSDDKSNGQAS